MYKDLDKLIDSVANRVKTPAEARNLATTVWMAAGDAGLTICDLKPLAERLGCEPELGAIKDSTRSLLGALVSANRSLGAPYTPERMSVAEQRFAAQVAQALNWERTEFDTLDELLAELRCATVCDLRPLAAGLDCEADIKAITEAVKVLLLPEVYGPTHAVLHGTEYYPGSTILLQTAQLVAWRDADGQEHCERAHRVTLNPDSDGLAAAILSGIAGAQIAPEHIAEMRAQMGGVL